MEVHAHSHPAPGGTRKKWTHYFWEFLMLFLAVFCGFLAEYQLEHKIEKDREKQFIRSYIEDLETDTASARRTVNLLTRRQTRLDSFILLLKTEQIRGHENDLYYFGRTLLRSVYFQRNDRTLLQLVNSGSWRLIRNKKAADSMLVYNKLTEQLEGDMASEGTERTRCIPLLEKVYDPFVFDAMVDSSGIHRVQNNPPLLSYDRALQKELAHKIHQIKGSLFLIVSRMKQVEDKASRLIVLLKKEYRLK